MKNQTLDVRSDVRELVEKTIDQTEKAFSFFFQQANLPGDTALNFAQQNVAFALVFACKFAAATIMQEVVALQAEYLCSLMERASKFMREFTPKL